MRSVFRNGLAFVGAVGLVVAGWVLAAPPEAPKVSTFAPAKDIESQIDRYVRDLEEAVESEETYKESEAKIAKASNTLVLLALAAGLHDEDNAYKQAAPGLIKAAQELASVKGFEAAKTAVAGVKKAMESKGAVSGLKWEKIASLPQTMKQVPLVNSRLKRNLRASSFAKKAKDNAGDAAALAVIAQGSLPDTSEAKNDDEVKKWYAFCVQMRDAAAALNKAVHAKDAKAAEKAMTALNQSCDDCHTVFHKEALTAKEEEEK